MSKFEIRNDQEETPITILGSMDVRVISKSEWVVTDLKTDPKISLSAKLQKCPFSELEEIKKITTNAKPPHFTR